MTRNTKAILCAILVAVMATIPALGQQPGAGFPPFGSFQPGGFDSINRQSLNVNFAIPIVHSPGRGRDLSFSVVYNSLVWRKNGSVWTPVTGPGVNWGWNANPIGYLTYKSESVQCWYEGEGDPPPMLDEWTTRYYDFAYVDSMGTVHQFDGGIDYHESATPCDYNTDPREGFAVDNSGLFLNQWMRVVGSDGNELTEEKSLDSNGNYNSVSNVSGQKHWKDSRGQLALKIETVSSTTIKYHVLNTSGGYEVYTLSLQSTNIKTNFGCGGVSEYTGSGYLPQTLTLPTGKTFSFTYEDTPGHSGYKTARLSKVTLPTGGYYEYAYFGSNYGISCSDGTTLRVERKINDGSATNTWKYERTTSGSDMITTVTAPQLSYDSAANVSTYKFNSSWREIEQKHYQGSTSGTLLRTVTTSWSAYGTPTSTTVILDSSSTQTKTDTTIDGYGNLTNRKEYDWGSGAAGSLKRETIITYENGSNYTSRNIVDRPKQILVKDGSGNVVSRTDITYDESSYSNVNCHTGAAQHDDTNYGCSFYYRGNPTTVTSYTAPATPSGGVSQHFYYDNLGNLRKIDVNGTLQKEFVFSSTTQYAFPDQVKTGPSAELVTSATYNNYIGQVATATDANSKTTTFSYDSLKRLTSVQQSDGTTISTSYDDTYFKVTTTTPIDASNNAVQKAHFDALGRVYLQELKNGAGTLQSAVTTQFDTLGRAFKVSNPHTGTPSYWTETRVDALGRPKSVIAPDSNSTTYSYSSNTVEVTDPTGIKRKSETDALGRLTKLTEPDPDDSNSMTLHTNYTYSTLDLLTQVSQGSQTRTYSYDGLGRATSVANPETGTWSYQYNAFGQVTSRTDARTVVTSYSYDSLNRPSQISYNVGSTGVPAPPQVDYVYGTDANSNNKGRLYQVKQSSTVVETYSYDSLGRVTQVVKNLNGSNYTTSYAYNKANELTSVTYPSSRVVTQSYDSVGRLSQVSSSGTNYVSSLAYNTAGQVTGFNYGNGVAASFTYSAQRHQLTALSYVKDSTTLLALSYYYSYDANCTGAPSGNNGQIHCIKDTTATEQQGRSVQYTYDYLYRLKTAVTAGSTTYPQWGLSWTYDRYGNRLSQSVDAGSGPSNSVSVSTSTNRITTGGYGYDANGNMTNDGLNTLVYDAENRVASINSGATSYSYDAAGLRVKKVTGSTTTVYVFSGTKVIAEYVGGSLNKEYIYSGSALVATHDAGTLKYHHSDHLSVRVTTNTSGGIIAEQGHYPFGESWYQGSGGTKIQFTSYERDSESGNDYANARYYISRLGRFNVPDIPFADQHIGNPQSWNLYSYVRNSPVMMVDPTGMAADPEDPEDPGYMFQMEAPNALNTWGSTGCVPCQFPLDMLVTYLTAFERLNADWNGMALFVNGQPMNDYAWRITPGYKHSSEQAAAAAAYLYIMATSLWDRHEYGAKIYQDKKGRYAYSAWAKGPAPCDSGQYCGVTISQLPIPRGATWVSSFHTHPTEAHFNLGPSIEPSDYDWNFHERRNMFSFYIGAWDGPRLLHFTFSPDPKVVPDVNVLIGPPLQNRP